jgi:site-specific DNA-cytosine methylase
MKVLELFAGTRSIGKAFEAAGHEVFSVEWDKSFEDIDLYADIMTVTAADIVEKFGLPDVVWASPDCTTFSIAAISHHRYKDPDTGYLLPKSEYAKFCDKVDRHVMELIDELNRMRLEQGLPELIFFAENPVGGMRKTDIMEGRPRYTITYCQYELDKPVNQRRKKPTDIWTNHPDPQFRPMCKNGDPCHASAPRSATVRKLKQQGIEIVVGGTQYGMKNSKERSTIPRMLCEHIVYICEKAVKK